jgi:hypothetical protein
MRKCQLRPNIRTLIVQQAGLTERFKAGRQIVGTVFGH